MGTEARANETACNPEAVAFTMLMGVGFGVVAAAALAIGAHVLHELSTNQLVATPSLVSQLMVSGLGGLVFGLVATLGAALALWIVDPRLACPRLVQAVIAGVGAILPALALFAFLGQTAAVDARGAAAPLTLVGASAFVLMFIRSRSHTVSVNTVKEVRRGRSGINL